MTTELGVQVARYDNSAWIGVVHADEVSLSARTEPELVVLATGLSASSGVSGRNQLAMDPALRGWSLAGASLQTFQAASHVAGVALGTLDSDIVQLEGLGETPRRIGHQLLVRAYRDGSSDLYFVDAYRANSLLRITKTDEDEWISD